MKLEFPEKKEIEEYTEKDYDDMLDDCYGEINICGLMYSSSYVLKIMDSIRYDEGFHDFQQFRTVFECPHCGEQYDDYDEALWCCQSIEIYEYYCLKCGEVYSSATRANNCCRN